MDPSLISAAIGSIRAAKDLATAAVSVRDWNLVATELAKVNEQLLRAQDALFSHNAQLLEMQQELFAAKDELRRAKETLAERGRYALSETSRGAWAYRERPLPVDQNSNAANADSSRVHYVCQPCFDAGKKAILQIGADLGGALLHCPLCKTRLRIDLIKDEIFPSSVDQRTR